MSKKQKEMVADFWRKETEEDKQKKEEMKKKKEQEEKKITGRCECGNGNFKLSLRDHDLWRRCTNEACKKEVNVDEYMRRRTA